MTNSVLGDVSALRWYLPLRTPSGSAHQDRVDEQADNICARLVRDTPIEAPRVAHLSRTEGGDQADPEAAPNSGFSITGAEAEGRAAILRSVSSFGG